MTRFAKLLERAQPARLATRMLALWILFKHPATPWAPKLVAIAVIAYAVSPIDLIPDFIPVLGLLDDILLLPLGIALVVRLTPQALWQARVAEAEAGVEKLPRLWWGAAVIVLVWLALLGGLGFWWWSTFAASGSV